MPIRFATLSDVPALVEGAGRAHALASGRRRPYDMQRAGQALSELIEQRQSTYGCFVAEGAGGRIVGALIGAIERRILSNACMASVLHFEVLPDSRMAANAIRLLGAFEAWSVNRGAIEIGFELRAAQIQRLGRFATRMGFRMVGASYLKGPCG